MHELICIADVGSDFSHVVEALRRVATVTQLLPPRLALAQVHEHTPPQIRGAACFRGEIPPEILAGLTARERLFITAARTRVRHKPRPGDARPWDSPGFTPPDPPPVGRL